MERKFVLIVLFLFMGCEDKLAWIKIPATAPTVYSIAPETGTAGTTVTISGANFSTTPSGNNVKIHQTSATVIEASSSTIKFVAPNETSGPVVVTVNNLVAENRPMFTYQ